jgi:predicted amidohydrolase
MAALRGTSPWFPDLVARWYDDFAASTPFGQADLWRRTGSVVDVDSWLADFIADPHRAAGKMDSWIAKASSQKEPERRYRALQVASAAIAEVGFQVDARNDAQSWKELQRHWRGTGNLLREAEGLLLPVEKRPYPWVWRSNPLQHAYESHRADFGAFARWMPSSHPGLAGLKVRVVVLPRSMVPIESLERQLKVAVVPLVPSTSDFQWRQTELDGIPAFRVALHDPGPIGEAALAALRRAADENCDVLVFPELCLTPAIQAAIGNGLFKNPKRYPWLVVAGSAPAPAPDAPDGPDMDSLHNRAIVFDGKGQEVLRYHKLHRYEMSRREQDRYGIADVCEEINRLEDIEVAPFVLGVLDTPVGRMGVAICEDLSAVELLEPLVSGLGLDWLLAPVLDGAQTRDRWTARFGRRYAERGAALVVATSLSLVSRHCDFAAGGGRPMPPGVGLVVRPTLFKSRLNVLSSDHHAQPAVINLVGKGAPFRVPVRPVRKNT